VTLCREPPYILEVASKTDQMCFWTNTKKGLNPKILKSMCCARMDSLRLGYESCYLDQKLSDKINKIIRHLVGFGSSLFYYKVSCRE